MRTDAVIAIVGAHEARNAASPADYAGARWKLPVQDPGLAAAMTR